jgi:hypothetical protein
MFTERGTLQSNNIKGTLPSNDVVVKGTLPSNDVVVKGTLPSNDVVVKGTLPSNDVVVKGTLQSNDIKGTLQSNDIKGTVYELLKGDLPYEIIERIDRLIQVDFFNKALDYFKSKNNIKYNNNLKYHKLNVIFGASELSTNVYTFDDIKVFFNKNNDWNRFYIKLPNSVIKNYVISHLDDIMLGKYLKMTFL